jgi:putative Mg2+ transporter-C (MgtC) family protein
MDPNIYGWADVDASLRAFARLAGAAVLGGAIGLQRERAGKAAGIRTHMMVALGAALFVLVPSMAGFESGDLSRVIQGIAAGIGFLGGGTIIKGADERDIEGLTSAATIWFTAAIGIAVGAGQGWIALLGVASAWLVLSVARALGRWVSDDPHR